MLDYDEEAALALRLFGAQIKYWRGLLGMTREEFAKQVGYSVELVASIEQGRRVPRGAFFAQADRVLQANGVIRAAEAFLSIVVKRPVVAAELVDVEREAVCLNYFDAMAIPALLHTEAYTRAVLGAFPPILEDAQLDLLVAAHLERGTVLDRRLPARIGFIIDESALRRPVGGRGVLAEQLARVTQIARRANVTLQVLPLECGDHAGLSGSIALVETAEWQRVAYCERAEGSGWVTSPHTVSRLHQRYGIIRAQAMTTHDSLDLIEKLATEDG